MIGITKRERERLEKISACESSHKAIQQFINTTRSEFEATAVTIEMCYDGDLKTRLLSEQEIREDYLEFLHGELEAVDDALIDLRAPGWVAS